MADWWQIWDHETQQKTRRWTQSCSPHLSQHGYFNWIVPCSLSPVVTGYLIIKPAPVSTFQCPSVWNLKGHLGNTSCKWAPDCQLGCRCSAWVRKYAVYFSPNDGVKSKAMINQKAPDFILRVVSASAVRVNVTVGSKGNLQHQDQWTVCANHIAIHGTLMWPVMYCLFKQMVKHSYSLFSKLYANGSWTIVRNNHSSFIIVRVFLHAAADWVIPLTHPPHRINPPQVHTLTHFKGAIPHVQGFSGFCFSFQRMFSHEVKFYSSLRSH